MLMDDHHHQQQKEGGEQSGEAAGPADAEAGRLLVPRPEELAAAKGGDAAGQPQAQTQPPAPDGGWGWVVAVAVGFSVTVMVLPMISFPFIFADYLEEIGQGSEGVTTIIGLVSCISSFTGLLCNSLFQRFSFRQIALMGSAFYVLGQGAIAFATTFPHFLLCAALLGFGGGLIAPAVFTSINSYFERRRTFVMGLIQFALGLGTVAVPIVTQKMVAALGFRNTQCILAAITLTILPASVTLRPIKYEASDGKGATSTDSVAKSDNSEEKKKSSVDYVNEKQSHHAANYEENNSDLVDKKKVEDKSEKDGTPPDEDEKRDLLGNNAEGQKQSEPSAPPGPAHRRSRISIASSVGLPFPEHIDQLRKKSSQRWWLAVVDAFELRMLLDWRFTNVVVGISVSFFVDIMFMTLVPLYLFHHGFSHEDSAFCVSVIALSDLVGRFTLAVVGACCAPNNRRLFLASAAVAVVLRAMYIFFTDYTAVLVLSAILGFSKCCILSIVTLVLGEACSVEKFPAAFGLQSVFGGMLSICFGPLLGKLKDITGSFDASIILLTVLGLLCVIPWTLELLIDCTKKPQKKSQN